MTQIVDRVGNVGAREVAGVEFLADDDARIAADFPVELRVAHIDGADFGRAVLEQAIGETAGARADVEAGRAGRIDGEMRRARLRA